MKQTPFNKDPFNVDWAPSFPDGGTVLKPGGGGSEHNYPGGSGGHKDVKPGFDWCV